MKIQKTSSSKQINKTVSNLIIIKYIKLKSQYIKIIANLCVFLVDSLKNIKIFSQIFYFKIIKNNYFIIV